MGHRCRQIVCWARGRRARDFTAFWARLIQASDRRREVHRALASWSRATDLSRILFQNIVPTQHPKGVLGLLFPMCGRDDRPPCCSDRLLHEPSKWNRFMITAVATEK